MGSWRRVAETAAIIGAVALAVIVAGPGGAVQYLLQPIVSSGVDPAARLRDLSFGIPLAVMLVPGLTMWAWGSGSRPSGTVLTVLPTLAVTVDLASRGRLNTLAMVLVTALWLLTVYQVATVPRPSVAARRPAALLLSAPSCAAPWILQAGRLVLDQLRSGAAARGEHLVVIVFAVTVAALLLLPVVHVRAFAAVGFVAAVAATLYALVSLRWPSPFDALPLPLAILAVATAVAYVDTVRQLSSESVVPQPQSGEPTAGGVPDHPDGR